MKIGLDDSHFMREAMKEAHKALEKDEVPIGAILVYENNIIARAHNQTITLSDVTAHAEMLVISSALTNYQLKNLEQCTLYVTLEPCPMCASAMYWAQIGRLVYATPDPKRGYTLYSPSLLHPKTSVTSKILSHEASLILKEFFLKLRKKN